ncbi:glycosyl hydrolases family 18 [Cordyceps javanica]|uniref:chitinase n=1 Tax=Cordyceps javanica TaxID=43265 RepID=A0A545W6C8_9HYPO|nr:glycosyl hydrolases family 18 [Cordyceps javanica]TQW09468.1 glycosyl hydrolases family 18 [Cordyceps javanica]
MAPSLRGAALGALGFLSAGSVSAQSPKRIGASPGFRGMSDACPEQCINTGADPANWSVYHNMDQLAACKQPLFYSFALHDPVDDSNSHHRIYACSVYGDDWVDVSGAQAAAVSDAEDHQVEYEVGWWTNSTGSDAGISGLAKEMREYVAKGHAPGNETTMLFGKIGGVTAGLYMGRALDKQHVASTALSALRDEIHSFDGSRGDLAMQLCDKDYDADHIFGFMAVSNGTFDAAQSAFKAWYDGKCLEFPTSHNLTGKAQFTSVLLSSVKGSSSNSTSFNGTSPSTAKRWADLAARGQCRTIQVEQNDSCGKLAQKCGISGADFTKYNSAEGFCANLRPKQHVCCSAGDMPDFRPKPNGDGSCATVTVTMGENCDSIAAANSLKKEDLDDFNKNTWAWTGCGNVLKGAVICVSKGSPPMPDPIADAVCGPQVAGTKKPSDMSKISELNPCPLNACCDVWGQCGITDEFCTDTGTGAPGTAKPNTNGCISNCGTKIVKGDVSEFRSIAYYEGFHFNRKCLFQDALQIDGSQYTHLHFGFGDISPDFKISIGDEMATYEFNNFRFIRGPKKILSFGGWEFSNAPATYDIFRRGVQAGNREVLAKNIANFINDNGLDGVDIDWEYPGATDIPGTPPGDPKTEGTNYLKFLVTLKGLLPNKSVSIAAPASYWYLKPFPIKRISQVVDYIVYMTYDLHGQWDAGNPNSQPGCDDGRCLRSQVNLTETMSSLSMITKAGVNSGKVVVGVTSYGRSFAMAEAGCHGEQCKYTGSRLQSNAAKGECTDTAGYISNAEISKIVGNSSRVNEHYVDSGSNSNVLVYDNTQWVAYMTPALRKTRTNIYKNLKMGGTTNWATDLEDFNDAPEGVKDWANFRLQIKAGKNPLNHAGDRTGNWTKLTCDDKFWTEKLDYTPSQRWAGLDAKDAWTDIINDWKQYRKDRPNSAKEEGAFSQFISYLIGNPPDPHCEDILTGNNCRNTWDCKEFKGDKSGPAAALIWNSLVKISSTYAKYHQSVVDVSALLIDNTLSDFENKFAPVPPPEDQSWLNILLSFVSMGAPMIGSKFFTGVIAKLPALASKTPEAIAKGDKVVQTIISGGVSIGVNLKGNPKVDDWTDGSQKEFSHYIGQSLYVWDNITAVDLGNLFDGSDESINKLTDLMADGKFIDGYSGADGPLKRDSELAVRDDSNLGTPSDDEKTSMKDAFLKSFYGFAIPAIWKASGHHPFIIDTGFDCDHDAGKTLKSACYEGKRYQLADPDGKSHPCDEHNCGLITCSCPDSDFSSLKGADLLTGSDWGGIKVEDIIVGSVKTWLQNDKTNGGGDADPTDAGTLQGLRDEDVTTPGYIKLPVCNQVLARRSWANADDTESARGKDFFPCNTDNGKDYCGASTFENQGSDASPLVEDCLTIIRNIEGTDGSWNISPLKKQRELVKYGSCRFGVTGTNIKGNVSFNVGAQDIVDIIKDAIKQFGGTGRVGAKGNMQCDGNIKKQDVEWGLY